MKTTLDRQGWQRRYYRTIARWGKQSQRLRPKCYANPGNSVLLPKPRPLGGLVYHALPISLLKYKQ